MQRLIISGDPHLRVSSIETARRFLAFLTQTVAEQRPDGVIVLGDLFDSHAVMRLEILNLWTNYLGKQAVPHVLMVGNHDKAGPNAQEHALVGLDRFPGITIVDKPTQALGMSFLPYYHTDDEFRFYVKQLPRDTKLFVHNTFEGAAYEGGYVDPYGFPLALVEHHPQVISGHVHVAQQVGNVTYPGSPYHFGFADAGEIKGLHLLEGSKLTLLPSPLPVYRVLRFESVERFLDTFPTLSLREQDHFKVIVPMARATAGLIATDPRYLALKAAYRLHLEPIFQETPRRQGAIQKAVTLEGMVDAYVSEVLVTDLDRSRLAAQAQSLLKGTNG